VEDVKTTVEAGGSGATVAEGATADDGDVITTGAEEAMKEN
jgi:hypothetical protein